MIAAIESLFLFFSTASTVENEFFWTLYHFGFNHMSKMDLSSVTTNMAIIAASVWFMFILQFPNGKLTCRKGNTIEVEATED